jgi:hypothetical protein
MLLRWCVSTSASLCTRVMLDMLRLPCRRLGIFMLGRNLQFDVVWWYAADVGADASLHCMGMKSQSLETLPDCQYTYLVPGFCDRHPLTSHTDAQPQDV